MHGIARGLVEAQRARLVSGVGAVPLVSASARWRLLRALGVDVSRCVIGRRVQFRGPDIAVAAGAVIEDDVVIEAAAPVYVGTDARLGTGTRIVTKCEARGGASTRNGALPVLIGARANLGARVVVLPGVTVGEGAVIAPDAVVEENCRPNSVYAGAPARFVRRV